MLQVEKLKKSYQSREAVRGISFQVKKGEAFGLLGPNGAGKSTTISMIFGLAEIDSGDVRIGGISVKDKPIAAKQKIGVVPQDIALYPTMSARENLIFWGRMYGLRGSAVKQRADEVLRIVGLFDRAKEKIATFSGGMKRRINIGAALMHEPELLIMDEPTVGIDPQSRNHILETVKELNQSGMTIIYTSHYMEEVEYLCDRIAIMDHGDIIAAGTKHELCNRLAGGSIIRLTLDKVEPGLTSKFGEIAGVQEVTVDEGQLVLYTADARQVLGPVVSAASSAGSRVASVDVQEPNLETVFLQLTGRTLRD